MTLCLQSLFGQAGMWAEKLEVKLFVCISAQCFEAPCWGLSSGFLLHSHGNRCIIKGTFHWEQLLSLGLNREGEGRLPKAIVQGPLLHALGYLEALEMFLPPILWTCF